MRGRWVKPEFFTDRKIADLGPVAALVYQALWCLADDGGTAPADPEIVHGALFSRWSAVGVPEITGALQALSEAVRIECYSVGDDTYAIIKKWSSHQQIHKPSKFRYPKRLDAPNAEQCGTGAGDSGTSPHPRLLDSKTPRHLETASAAHANGNGAPQEVAVVLAEPAVAVVASRTLALDTIARSTDARTKREAYRAGLVGYVFSYWANRLGHQRSHLDPQRERRLLARLAECEGNPNDLLYAVDGALRDPWTIGKDPHSVRAFDGVETIFRDRGKVETLAALVPAWSQGVPHPRLADIPQFEAN